MNSCRYVYKQKLQSSDQTDNHQPNTPQPVITIQPPPRDQSQAQPIDDYYVKYIPNDPGTLQPPQQYHQFTTLPKRLPSVGSSITQTAVEREVACHHCVSAPFHHENTSPHYNKHSQVGMKTLSYTNPRGGECEYNVGFESSSDAIMMCKDVRGAAVMIDEDCQYLSDTSDLPASGTALNLDMAATETTQRHGDNSVAGDEQTVMSDAAFTSYSERAERSLASKMETVVVKENDHYVVKPLRSSAQGTVNKSPDNGVEVCWRNEQQVYRRQQPPCAVAFQDTVVVADNNHNSTASIADGRLETKDLIPIMPDVVGVTSSRYKLSDPPPLAPLEKNNNSIVNAGDDELETSHVDSGACSCYQGGNSNCNRMNQIANCSIMTGPTANNASVYMTEVPLEGNYSMERSTTGRPTKADSNPWVDNQHVMRKADPHPATLLLGEEVNSSRNAKESSRGYCQMCESGEIHCCGVSINQSHLLWPSR